MHNQSSRTLQTARTSESPEGVLQAARAFFSRRNAIYAAYVEKEGPGYLTFRGQGGEEIVVAAFAQDGGTVVNGSSYMFDQQVARFLSTLAPAAPAPAGAAS
ncbi:MAG: hypothetical protein ACYC3L_06085 [Gemmatimonadaceae bacterium]